MKKIKNRFKLEEPVSASMGTMEELFKNAGFSVQLPKQDKETAHILEVNQNTNCESVIAISLKQLRIRCEKKHRGGKTVTLIEGLKLDLDQLRFLIQEMKSNLGCGGTIENNTIVLQGEMVDRAKTFLSKYEK